MIDYGLFAFDLEKKSYYYVVCFFNMVITADKNTFQTEVLDYKEVVMVDFYADWCGPCKMTGPVIDELSEEIKQVKFVKVNVDQNPELTSQYQIFSIPTFLIIKGGQVVNQLVGAVGKESFLAEINKVLA